jgi:hypothetical protein
MGMLWVLLPTFAWHALAQSAFTSGAAWCDDATRSTWPICNPSAPVDERAADIVSRLTLDDKITLTSNDASAGGISLPKWNWWNEATHGVWHNVGPPWPCESNPCDGPVTVFALPITTSCSFNRTMWYKTGNQIGREARAFWNSKGDVRGGTYWTPVINIVRLILASVSGCTRVPLLAPPVLFTPLTLYYTGNGIVYRVPRSHFTLTNTCSFTSSTSGTHGGAVTLSVSAHAFLLCLAPLPPADSQPPPPTLCVQPLARTPFSRAPMPEILCRAFKLLLKLRTLFRPQLAANTL